MVTVTKAIFSCDVCGNANDVQTRCFGLDGKAYEIDLCLEDSNGLSKVADAYMSKARAAAARRGKPQKGRRARSRGGSMGDSPRASGNKSPARGRGTGSMKNAKPSRPGQQAARASGGNKAAEFKGTPGGSGSRRRETRAASEQAATASGAKAKAAESTGDAGESRSQPRKTGGTPEQAAKATSAPRQKGIYVYGILPADIEVTGEMPGVGEHPGRLELVSADGLAALTSVVGAPGRLGSPEDRRAHREILDSAAIEVPVLPLRFGTVLTSKGAVTDELLAPHHDEFAAALAELEGRAEFLVKGRYVKQKILREVLAKNEHATRLRDTIRGKDPGATRDARAELREILDEAVKAKREEDTRALREAMETVAVASVLRKPKHQLDAVNVAFLIAVDDESEMELVIEDLAREWVGRIEVQLLGPMAAYHFVGTGSEVPGPATRPGRSRRRLATADRSRGRNRS